MVPATVGGLGLTGLITWIEIRLQRIANPLDRGREPALTSLNEFFALNDDYEARYPYIVSWDRLRRRRAGAGAGIYLAGMHAPPGVGVAAAPRRRSLTVPSRRQFAGEHAERCASSTGFIITCRVQHAD